METKTNKLLQAAKEIMRENADILIISHKNEKCGAATNGDLSNIAKAIFSCMHHPDSPIGTDIYRIIKLNVLNIIANESPYSADLLQSINSMLSNHE